MVGVDTSRAAWRTSTYSNNGGNCVEVASATGIVAVRDTRDRDRAGAVLTFGLRAWARFAATLKG